MPTFGMVSEHFLKKGYLLGESLICGPENHKNQPGQGFHNFDEAFQKNKFPVFHKK
jgi:hypothetical protein